MKGAVIENRDGHFMDKQRKDELCEIARQIRIGIIDAVHSAKSGHPGGSLSIADVLAYLYFEEMNIDPKNPKASGRDRMVLSKGHCAPGLYAALALRGYFPVEDLKTFRHTTSYLQGHPAYFARYGRIATFSGILNAFTYIGSALAMYGFGALSDKLSWQATIVSWLVIAGAGIVLALLTIRRWTAFVGRK